MNSVTRKGIVLAGGSGTRLHPLTLACSKQLLPIYDKPLVYYPLSVLMLAGIKEILIITTPDDQASFKRLLGDGGPWGISIEYAVQPEPRGLADAYIVADAFLDGSPSAMVLGDNLFFGHGFTEMLHTACMSDVPTIFSSHVSDPHRFGIVEIDGDDKVVSIEEKPQNPKSNNAVTGLYFFNAEAPAIARQVEPSLRGEIEITSIIQHYLDRRHLRLQQLHRGFAWLDAGTHASLSDAGEFVQTLQQRQGLLVCSPDEIAFNMGFITLDELETNADKLSKSSYGLALKAVVQDRRSKANHDRQN
ncbi:MAG: glucose-1-phosphate thymidylyltransferase RfbA [Pseudomonadota bacterium]